MTSVFVCGSPSPTPSSCGWGRCFKLLRMEPIYLGHSQFECHIPLAVVVGLSVVVWSKQVIINLKILRNGTRKSQLFFFFFFSKQNSRCGGRIAEGWGWGLKPTYGRETWVKMFLKPFFLSDQQVKWAIKFPFRSLRLLEICFLCPLTTERILTNTICVSLTLYILSCTFLSWIIF